MARLARHAADRVLLPLNGRPFEATEPTSSSTRSSPRTSSAASRRSSSATRRRALLAARTREGRDAFASPLVSLVDDATAPGGLVRGVRTARERPRGGPASSSADCPSAASPTSPRRAASRAPPREAPSGSPGALRRGSA